METPAHCWAWRPAAPSRIDRPVGLLRLEGPDALRVLHGQTSQAIELAAPGQALATCVISPTARLRALAQVLVDTSGAWLLIEAGDGSAVRTALDRVLFPADRVALGPLQQGLLVTPVLGAAETALPPDLPVGEAGRWQPLQGRAGLWQLEQQLVVAEAGASLPEPMACRQPLEAQELERWRMQQGLPAAPGELNEDTNPFELGLARRVSLNKGCYVGQETLAKLATYDGVKQQLRRWCWQQPTETPGAIGAATASTPPHPGQGLINAAGERAGTVSSALALPQSDGSCLWLGLALVRRNALEHTTLRLMPQPGASTEVVVAISRPEAFADPPVGQRQPAR